MRRMVVLSITMASLTFWPMILQATTFSVYIGTGHKIDLSTAYTVMTVFNLMQGPLRMLPMFIGSFIEFTVAMRRIQKFLICDEINPAIIEQQQQSDVNAIEIRKNANFHWGISPEDQDNKDEKKKEHKAVLKSRKNKGKVDEKEENK